MPRRNHCCRICSGRRSPGCGYYCQLCEAVVQRVGFEGGQRDDWPLRLPPAERLARRARLYAHAQRVRHEHLPRTKGT